MRSFTMSRLPLCEMALCTAAVIAVAAMQSVACGRPPLAEEERPWEKGRRVSDSDMEEILKPDRPVESAGLYLGTDGRTYYVARLEERPSIGYLRKYAQLVQSRGFLTRPYVTSPHELPPRTLGYDFLVFKKGRVKPFTLLYREFGDRDPRWTERKTIRNFPEPFSLDGPLLIVRLGFSALRPWQESILVPDEDVVQVKEFPFPRFPGSILARVYSIEESDLLDDASLTRDYVVRQGSIEDVIDYYERTITQYGIPIQRTPNRSHPLWWSSKDKVANRHLIHVSIRPKDIAPVPGSGLTLNELKEHVPGMLQEYSEGVIAFSVSLEFVDVDSASVYWIPEDQERRRVLLTQKKQKQ